MRPWPMKLKAYIRVVLVFIYELSKFIEVNLKNYFILPEEGAVSD